MISAVSVGLTPARRFWPAGSYAQFDSTMSTAGQSFAIVALARYVASGTDRSAIIARCSAITDGIQLRRSVDGVDRIGWVRARTPTGGQDNISLVSSVVVGEWRWYGGYVNDASDRFGVFASSYVRGRSGHVDIWGEAALGFSAGGGSYENSAPWLIGACRVSGTMQADQSPDLALVMVVPGTWSRASLGALLRDPLAWRSRAWLFVRPGVGPRIVNEGGASVPIARVATIVGTPVLSAARMAPLRTVDRTLRCPIPRYPSGAVYLRARKLV